MSCYSLKEIPEMLLNRDYVGHMASQVVKKLVEDEQIAIKEKEVSR